MSEIEQGVKDFIRYAGLGQESIEANRKVFVEEFGEALGRGWMARNRVEQIDGLSDSCFVHLLLGELGYEKRELLAMEDMLDGLRRLLDLSMEQCRLGIIEVCRSNLTKFDTTYTDAIRTKQYYASLNIHTTMRKNDGMYATFVATDGWVRNKYLPKGKLLKSAGSFESPCFDHVIGKC